MHCLGWMTIYLLIGATIQKSIPLMENVEEKGSLDFLNDYKHLTSKEMDLVEEEEEKNLEEQYNLVSSIMSRQLVKMPSVK